MAVARLSTYKVNLDCEPQGLYLRPHKGTFQINSVLLFQHCPTSLARRVLPEQDLTDETCPTKPDKKAEARQQPSTGANLPGELCARLPGSDPRRVFSSSTGEADSGLDRLWRKKKTDVKHTVDNGVKIMMKSVLEETKGNIPRPKGSMSKIEVPSFLNGTMGKGMMKFAMVNMDEYDLSEWDKLGKTIPIHFNHISDNIKWDDLFPTWIDEEEESDVPTCPKIPMLNIQIYEKMDMVVAKLPCKYPEEGWRREVFRLQVHLIVANLAVRRGKRDGNRKTTKMLFWSKCRPMLEIFRCDDLVRQEGNWWLFEPDMARLRQKVSLPVGTCNLALPFWGQQVYDLAKIQGTTNKPKREAYVTVLHSSDSYVCGAITLAKSLLQTGTKRDLVLLLDNSISAPKRDALSDAGWKLHVIERIRNPRGKKGTYNEYNYSKFRLWQLIEYDKIIFIDADIIVLRNLDLLFHFPQMSAISNSGYLFNSGIMVIEPSNCTFKFLMDHRDDIVSNNGGDQGYLNEVFVWWHRVLKKVNAMTYFPANRTNNTTIQDKQFGADPPKIFAIHYLGWKPWLCYRDYDCNWDTKGRHVFASDVAHERWWRVHDTVEEGLQRFCGLTKQRKDYLDSTRSEARKLGFPDEHWKINITDPRQHHLVA
ncbi:UDP-glucuronate:xylan alpha-glucuronosyltransferase 2-like [Malus domestica]|uniref:UDP-glucuronate:xylan alpha-glucuronosyltransferase 2-like n=1 Tax=Malus domestica TaxID=3750 RepID=UPI003974785A